MTSIDVNYELVLCSDGLHRLFVLKNQPVDVIIACLYGFKIYYHGTCKGLHHFISFDLFLVLKPHKHCLGSDGSGWLTMHDDNSYHHNISSEGSFQL